MIYVVKGYEFLSIDDKGVCYSSHTKRPTKPYLDQDGYYRVKVWCPVERKTKGCYVHRAIAIVFIKNEDPENLVQVNHKDSNRVNNSVDNLEWVSPKGNYEHGKSFGYIEVGKIGCGKVLIEQTVHDVCKMLQDGKSLAYIHRTTHINKSTLFSIKSKQCWQHISNLYTYKLPKKHKVRKGVGSALNDYPEME